MSNLSILHSEIYYWENVLNNTDELINLLNSLDNDPKSHNRISKWIPWGDPSYEDTCYGEQKIIDCNDILISSGDDYIDNQTLYLYKSFLTPSLEYSKVFLSMIGEDPEQYAINIDKFPIRRYKEFKEMQEHHDSIGANDSLKYSMILYLNDDYVGGELYFKNQDIIVKPKSGSFIIFPAVEPFIHQSKQLLEGVKYMCHTHIYKND